MKKLVFLAALTQCAAPAYAAPDRFGQMDTDGNGQVDWEEFQAAVPGMKRPAFDTIDADKSGGISRGEWDSFMKSHMGGQKGMPPAGMGMPAGMGGGFGSARSFPKRLSAFTKTCISSPPVFTITRPACSPCAAP